MMVSSFAHTSLLIIFSLASFLLPSGAASNNVTVDDQYGDQMTKVMPTYSPDGVWNQGASCVGCHVRPNTSDAYANTWHDATLSPNNGSYTIEISFTGSAVYAFFILANQVQDAATITNLSFSLDGSVVGSFMHYPTTSTNYQYGVLAFSNGDIENTAHTLVMSLVASTNDTLALFDHLVYTSENDSALTTTSSTSTANLQSSTSTPSSTGQAPLTAMQSVSSVSIEISSSTGSLLPPLSFTTTTQTSISSADGDHTSSGTSTKMSQNAIISGSIGGVVAVLVISAIVFLCIRRRQRRQVSDKDVTPFITMPVDNLGHGSSNGEHDVISIRHDDTDILSLSSSRADSLIVLPATSDVASRPGLDILEKDPFRRADEKRDGLVPRTHTPGDRTLPNPWPSDGKEQRPETKRERKGGHVLNLIATLQAEVDRLHDWHRQRGVAAAAALPPGYHGDPETRAL